MKDIEGTVRFIRLNNGEDLISFAYHVPKDDFEDGHYILNDPLKVVYITNTTTRPMMSISLMQWIFSRISDKQEFKISEKEILTTAEPSSSLIDFYYKTTEHFNKIKEEQKREIQFSNDEDMEPEEFDEDDYIEPSEGLEMLKDLLSNMGKDKKKLH
jgi:hypothetical protein